MNNDSLASTVVIRETADGTVAPTVHTGPVFSTMTSLIVPCLSALLLPPLLLLLLASSAYEQVRVVCTLSGAAALACSRRSPPML